MGLFLLYGYTAPVSSTHRSHSALRAAGSRICGAVPQPFASPETVPHRSSVSILKLVVAWLTGIPHMPQPAANLRRSVVIHRLHIQHAIVL